MIVGVQLSSGNSAPNSRNNRHLTIPFQVGMHSFKRQGTCVSRNWRYESEPPLKPSPLTCYKQRREDNQLDASEWFIALIICSTCFGQLYAHHQELETVLVLLPHMVCNALVTGGRRSGAGQQAMRPGWGKLCDWVAKFPSSRTHSVLLCS